MGKKVTKIVLVCTAAEVDVLQVIRNEQNEALRKAGVLRSASLADAARSAMVAGINAHIVANTAKSSADTVQNWPQESELAKAVAKDAQPSNDEAPQSTGDAASATATPAGDDDF